jgi:hypothetical protein
MHYAMKTSVSDTLKLNEVLHFKSNPIAINIIFLFTTLEMLLFISNLLSLAPLRLSTDHRLFWNPTDKRGKHKRDACASGGTAGYLLYIM